MKRAVKKKVFAITAVFLGLIIGLIFLEIVISIVFPQTLNVYAYDENNVFKFQPHASINYTSEEFSHYTTFNSEGFRDKEYEYYNKPDDVYRVLMLGDSFVVGLEVAQDETFTKIVEKNLRKEFPEKNIEVLSTATNGWSTEQELLFLENRGLEYNPDLVVLAYFVGNDQIDNVDRELFTYKNGLLAVNENRPVAQSRLRSVYYFLTANFHTSNFIQSIYWKIGKSESDDINYEQAIVEYLNPTMTPKVEYSWSKTQKLLERMIDLLDSHNVKKIVVLIPAQLQEKAELRKEQGLDDEQLLLDAPQQQIKNIMKSSDTHVIDLLYTFQYNANATLHYEHDFHWTAAGHALAAQQITSEISNFINKNQ